MSSIEPKRTGRPADEAKREAILAAAADCFFEHGFAASSIEQIAADAGVSKVTIYNRFGDKRALFTAAVELECEQLRDSLKVPEIPSGSLRHRLTAIGEAMVAFLSRPRMVQFERRIAADTEHEPAVGEAFLTAGPLRMKKAFAALIAAMHDAGEIEVGDPELAAEQFASMCKGMGDLERRFGAADDPDRNRRRIEGAVEVFCRAYARD
ncbi:TetR/AcrR family transcriptional regulator [Erythrobacter sp.]|uniref:TetR/AcrR family transcriptional regulator n=1 Tax=Erythrobacter sp. TaxID=1042 RepID=UPI001B0FA174|nr:TetR/AcrR family transcriptional regulator [Erythrobacter sp.]MBO6527389.1 TetR/AcrR family transcriptional regulator [Erythrobacter sp.]MBO6530773.1 TetR/AcrR family transcriptional regulator [Erythrobacter sp.]